MKVKLAAIGLAVAVMGALFAPMCTAKASAAEEPMKTIDVYVLAGQSNAAGCSTLSKKVLTKNGYTYTEEEYTYEKLLTDADERNKNGYENVFYYGAAGVYVSNDIPNPDVVPVKFGQGNSAGQIGPELGMANVLSKTATADHPAVILKYAAGGTTIGDNKGNYGIGLTKEFGNWASPTVRARWDVEGQKPYSGDGVMYDRLMQFFDNGMAKLKEMGYNPVLKGYAWMQGESDADVDDLTKEYEQNLTDVVNDIRKEISQKMEVEADANRPFVIGKICPTYNLGLVSSVGMTTQNVNKVRKMQDSVANKLSFCYTVETDDLLLVDTKARPTMTVGTDGCHFNANDMYELGKRFANALLDNTAEHSFCVTSGEGGAATRNVHTNGATLEIPYTADEGKVLDTVTLNGTAVTDYKTADGVITLTLPENVGEFNEIALTFTDAPEPANDFPAWAIAVIVVGGVLLIGGAVGLTFLLKNKKGKSGNAKEDAAD